MNVKKGSEGRGRVRDAAASGTRARATRVPWTRLATCRHATSTMARETRRACPCRAAFESRPSRRKQATPGHAGLVGAGCLAASLGLGDLPVNSAQVEVDSK